MIVGRTMWTQSTSVTDRQRDGRTDRQTDRITITDTVQRIASHGKNGINSDYVHISIVIFVVRIAPPSRQIPATYRMGQKVSVSPQQDYTLHITLLITGRFSKFFHCQNLRQI